MADLFALLPDDGSPLFAWRQGDRWQVSETPRGVAAKGRNVAVFIPPVEIAMLQATLPMKSERDARRAAPYAVEDDLAQSVDEVHIALGERVEDTTERSVCVIGEDRVEAWLARLTDLGLGDAALIVPQSILPDDDVLITSGAGIFGRVDGHSFALDTSTPRDLLQVLTGDSENLTRYELGSEPEALLEQLATWASAGQPIDLRQGPHAVRRPVDTAHLKRWRLVGGLAALWGLGWLGMQFWSAANMSQLTSTLDQRAEEIALAGWPEFEGDVDRVLASIRSQGGPAAVLPSVTVTTAALYEALAGIEGSELRSLRYDRQRGQVLAIVAYPEFADGDRLAGAFDNSGLQARVGDARQSGRQVVAELVLEAQS